MASKFLVPLDLSNFTNTPLANTSVGFVTVYVKNEYLKYLLPSGIEKDVVLERPLDGLSVPTLATGISSSDTLLLALSKLQASLNNIVLTGDVTGSATYIAGLLTINATLSTSGLTPANIANWNTAYSWGDHALAGYLKSVGLSTTGNAITISNSPLTTNGTIALGFAGNAAQYINGEGNLVTFPNTVTQAQNLITEVYNRSGDTLTKGTIVYINGGQGNLPTVTKAIATSDATSAQTFGIVQSDITNMSNGYVVVTGRLSDIDTQLYLEGTQLYLSGATAGTWTSTKPYAPIHLVYIGIVVRSHPVHGIIEVNIQNGYEMDELHDVSALNPNDNDILQYKTATNLWTKVAGTTSNISEGTNLYYTDARTRLAISLTTSGTSGAATYDNLTGVINIPNYATALTVGSTAIASGTVSRILFEGTGNVLQQSANLLWDEANNLLKIPNAKLEGGQFYGSYQPKLNLSANSGFSAIQYEFNTAAFLVGHVNVYGIGGAQDVFFQGNPNNTNSYVALEAINSAGLILATANNTNPIQFRINRGLRATLNNVGFGYGVVPTATLHAKGNSDSVGSVLKLESLSNNILEAFNTRDILIGGGSLSANTQVEINPYRAAGTSNYVFRVNAQGTDNYMRFINSSGSTPGGLYISRNSASISFQALSVGGAGGTSFILTSNGSIGINTASSGAINTAEIFSNGLVNSNVAGKNGQYFVTAGTNRGFTFEHLGAGSFNTGQAVFQITKNFTNSELGTLLDKLFEINGTYNFTNGTKGLIGINYNPTITALSGSHYGLVIRPSNTLNGIGHTTNLPTATWHIKGNSDSVGSSFRVENLSNTNSLNFANDGVLELRSNTAQTNLKSLLNIYNGAELSLQYSAEVGYQPTLRFYSSTVIGVITNATIGYVNSGGTAVFSISAPSNRIQYTSAQHRFIMNYTSSYVLFNNETSGIRIVGTLTPTGVSVTDYGYSAINIQPTINQTTTSGYHAAIDYNPILTNITGQHFGLLIRPTTLNGIGLGGLGGTLTVKPTSALDIQHTNGYTQFRLRTQYTPTSSADANGSQGDICFDDNFIYYKTSTGWKRGNLAPF